MKMKLEEEFKDTVLKHKANIVLKSLKDFYTDLYDAGGKFREEVIAEKSVQHFIQLFMNKEHFEDVYEKCWEKNNE